MLRTKIVNTPNWDSDLEASWRGLAAADPVATPFQTWEWQSTWLKHLGRDRRAIAWTLWEGEDLVGLMPFVESFSPWKALRPMGVGPSDYLQPIVRPRYEEKSSVELAAFLTDESKKRLVDLHQLRETLPLASAMGIPPQPQAACLVLDLPDSYEKYLETLGKSLRYDVKRLNKAPFADGRAKIVEVDRSNAAEAVDFFFEAHKKRWSKRGLPGAFLGTRIRDFHREWASLAAEKGWLWMSLLELDGQRVGAIYAMQMGSACYFYQSGFDPSKSSISPGTLLVAHTIRRAIEEGLTTFDFLRGDEPYKRRWKPQHSYSNLRFILGSGNALARLGANWNRRAFKWEARVRERFEGRSLKG